MKIKKAKIENINEIAKVELGSGYHKNKKFNPFPMLNEIFRNKKEKIFLAVENNLIVGYIAIREENKEVEITLLAVLKKYQRKGIGRKLLEYVLKLARKKKFKQVILEVRKDNSRAIKLYKKFDFVVVKSRKVNKIVKLKIKKK